MQTIRELAKICCVSEQAIRGWCRRNQVAKDAKGAFVISNAIESAIYEHYGVESPKLDAKSDNTFIEFLQAEIKTKNEQIQAQNQQLDQLQRLLSQEQHLRLLSEEKIQLLEQSMPEKKPRWQFLKRFKKEDEI